MKRKTKEKIWVYLDGFIQGLVNKYDPNVIKNEVIKKIFFDERKGEYKPFHMALLPEEFLRIQGFFRSFSTSLGQGVFEYIAKIIAEDSGKWEIVKRNAKFLATSSPNVQSFIDSLLENIERKNIKPYPISLPKPVDDSKKEIVVDLYLKDDTFDYFIEIKSPKPNKDQVRRTKEKFLYLLSTPDYNAKTFFAFPYNPYGENKKNYKWSFTKIYFDINNEVLIGNEFWDFIGGKGTYNDLLTLFKKFGEERSKEMIRSIIKF
ncbi:TdeIII family type II restriction endonuclease [Methanocaldococcus sp.]